MSHEEIDRALAESFQDHRLSRSERKELRRALPSPPAGSAERDRARAKAFELVRDALPPEHRAPLEWLADVVRALDAGQANGPELPLAEVSFSPGAACRSRIAGLAEGARERLDVCVYALTDDRIAEALLAAHRRGVRVRVISDDDKAADLGSDHARLAAAGIPVAVDDTPYHMHHKFLIADGRTLATGSYNFTRQAAERNLEALIVTDDPRLAGPFGEEFERLWRRFAPR